MTEPGGSALASDFLIAGSRMSVSKLNLANGSVQAYGSIPFVGGLNFPIGSTNPVTVASVPSPNTGNAQAVTAPTASVTFSPNLSVPGGGASFGLTDVTGGYDPAANNGAGGLFIDAAAHVTFGALANVSIALGDESHNKHGLVFDASGVTAVHASVATDAKISVGSLTLSTVNPSPANPSPKPLTLDYQKGGYFGLTGGATLSQQGGMSLTLALTGNGLVLDSGGNVTSVDGSVSGVLGVAGVVAVEAKNLTISYSDPTPTSTPSDDSFKVFGDVNVTLASLSVQSIQAKLGDAKNPGLKITNGKLDSFNVGLSGAFNLFGVSIAPQDLTLAYAAATGSAPENFKISGGLTVQLTDTIQVGAKIDPSAPISINVVNGTPTVDLTKFSMSLDADIKGFKLHADVLYNSTGPNKYEVIADGSLETPGGIGFMAHLHLVNGKLRDIGVGFKDRIAVGDTGLFITWVYGALHDLDDGRLLGGRQPEKRCDQRPHLGSSRSCQPVRRHRAGGDHPWPADFADPQRR